MAREEADTLLLGSLRKHKGDLAARVLEIREQVSRWLPQVVQLFPHYPSHGVDHSDRIAAQLSRLLYSDQKPAVPLSAAEIYCLLAAIYLHDIGMVVVQTHVQNILDSADWRHYTGPGGSGCDGYEGFLALKAKAEAGSDMDMFLADIALRQVISGFARREHHAWSKTILEMHPFLRQVVDCGDEVVFNTIANIALAHGLDGAGLDDATRFPERRTVLGEDVNVHFMARLLRIGDLLDLDSDRATPLSESAASPLPPESVPHWRQYSAKRHELVAPEEIAFRFECQDQNTHRVLRDWLGCLETEVAAAGRDQIHANRHRGWAAPRCKVASFPTADAPVADQSCTIEIRPAKDATYRFHEWKLELDQQAILNLLIHNLYDDPAAFVRELLQNALDATRCQMYEDSATEYPDRAAPACPSRFAQRVRSRYPILLTLAEEDVLPAPDEVPERSWVFTIEDQGTGMTEHVITSYFLQLGRSYYQSAEFQKRFRFAASSRFGVGFLSVFAVSDDVTVETARLDEIHRRSHGVRLRLRGPRSYLLTESWDPFPERPEKKRHGTRIRVVLRKAFEQPEQLRDLLTALCVNVEVPVSLRDGSRPLRIRPAPLIDGEILARSSVDPSATFVQRAFDVETPGVEGRVAVCAYVDSAGEGWCDCWTQEKDLAGQRLVPRPELPPSRLALHGIGIGGHYWWPWREYPWCYIIDVRAAHAVTPMSRAIGSGRHPGALERPLVEDSSSIDSIARSAIEETVEKLLGEHLRTAERAKGPVGTYYLGRALSAAPVGDSWRDKYPGTVATWESGARVDRSAAEVLSLDPIAVIYWDENWIGQQADRPIRKHPASLSLPIPAVSFADTPDFIHERLAQRVQSMQLLRVEHRDDMWVVIFGSQPADDPPERAFPHVTWWLLDLDEVDTGVVRPAIGVTGDKAWSILNRRNAEVQWLLRLRQATAERPPGLDSAAALAAWKVAAEDPWRFDDVVEKWSASIDIPDRLKPQLVHARAFYRLPRPRITLN